MSHTEPYPEWLASVPNHEMKPAVMFGLLSADHAVRGTELANEVNNLQAGLIDFSHKSPRQFCEQSLEPSGFTENVPVTYMKLGKYPATARGDRLTDFGLERGIALSGDVADWTLRYPDITLGEVLGKTVRSRTESGLHHAQLRYKILSNLALHDRLAVSDLTEMSPDNSSISNAVREMESEGILHVGRSHQKNSRTFEIINPDHVEGERRRKFENLVPERQLMFRTLRIAKKFRDTWQLDEFLNLAEAVENDPELLQKLNDLVQHLLAPSVKGTHNILRNVSGPLYEDGEKFTAVEIVEKVKPAVLDLVGTVSAHIAGDNAAIEGGTDKALRIMENPEEMAELIAKPRRLSSLVNKDPNFSDRLSDIILASKAPLDAVSIHSHYEKIAGRKVAVGTITIRLWELVKSGVINAQLRPHVIGKTQSAPFYTAA